MYRIARKAAKKMIMKKAETKFLDFGAENVQVYHNVGNTGAALGPFNSPWSDATFFNCWAAIPQGTGSGQRVGNEIYPRGMKLRLMLFNKATRPNLQYRIIIGTVPKLNQAGQISTPTNVNFLVPPQYNNLLTRMNTDLGCRAFIDRTYRNALGTSFYAQQGATSADPKESSLLRRYYIRRKKASKIIYSAGQGAVIVNKPVFLQVIPYDAFGTLVTDNVASYAYQCTLYWKDI